MQIKPLFLQLILCWISNLQQHGQDVGRLQVFPTIYESLIESQDGCLEKLNPNSIIESTVNQFETLVRADICTICFSLSFISVVNFLKKVFRFSCIVSYLSFDLIDIGRKLKVHKTSWTSSKCLMYVQFTSCVYWVVSLDYLWLYCMP